MAPTIDRTNITLTDDDGSGTTGTVFNDAWAQDLCDAIDAVIATEDAVVRTVAHGGTGVATLTGILKGNGTSAVTAITLPADATQFLNGTGAFSTPASGVTASGTLTATELVIGNGSSVVKVDANWAIEQTGHTLSSATQSRGTATNSNVQSIGNASETALTFDTNIDAIPSTIHNASSNTSKFVADYAGFYVFIASSGAIAANATGKRYMVAKKNGTTYVGPFINYPLSSGTAPSGLELVFGVTLAAADYLEVLVYQDSGGNLNFGSNGGVGSGGAAWAQLIKLF